MITAIILLIFCLAPSSRVQANEGPESIYSGSGSCLECHDKFHQLWSTSMHGMAMQPYTAELSKSRLTPQQAVIKVDSATYRADITKGIVSETGAQGTKEYRIEHVLGGKNVFYFLAKLDKGRLQTLPVAYDVNKKEWFDTAASGMRHFPGGEQGQTVNWKESPYTFNTACYSCHVSQLSTNYDIKTDSYHTTWNEPGINCETCHGLAAEHNRVAKATPKGKPLPKLGLISTKTMTKQQRNDLCSSCHAKASPLTIAYAPKERFYDHFDLITLEDPDFYPDGRDLGENYTATSWSMSSCAKSGKLDCIHCHTSSGRYRFKNENFNNACMPCHEDKVGSPKVHTHHPADSAGSRCISCHMPMTSFARMNRSDHSMLPPTPATTIAYQSPNACNNCHRENDAKWADSYVRKWRTRDYQALILKRASLVDAARKRDWTKLPEMLAYINDPKRDEVFVTSLIRMLGASSDTRITAVLLKAIKDPSPLIRGAAADALALRPTRESIQALLDATGDDYRLVRTRAVAGLAEFPAERLTGEAKNRFDNANREYLSFIMARPDQWSSHYNLGNYRLNRGELSEAIESFQAALKIEPQAVMALVNLSIAYAQKRNTAKAGEALQQALKVAPDNTAANFNMGLLQAELNETGQAESYLRKTMELDPQMAQASYNLCIITAKDRLSEALTWCRKAAEISPQEPRYSFTLAFYLNQSGSRDEAIGILKGIMVKNPEYKAAERLFAEITKTVASP